jgi:hypothetical protein
LYIFEDNTESEVVSTVVLAPAFVYEHFDEDPYPCGFSLAVLRSAVVHQFAADVAEARTEWESFFRSLPEYREIVPVASVALPLSTSATKERDESLASGDGRQQQHEQDARGACSGELTACIVALATASVALREQQRQLQVRILVEGRTAARCCG